MAGKDTATVRYKDLEPVDNALKRAPDAALHDALKLIGDSGFEATLKRRIVATYAPDSALPSTVTAEPANFRVAKVDEGLGLVFGWAIVCKVAGEDYYDLNIDRAGPHAGERVPEHIPEAVMTKAATEFMQTARVGNEMHEGPDKGTYVFAFPLTTDIAKAMGIQTEKTGLMVAYKPPADMLAKFKSGELRGFSIEGSRGHFTEHAA